jgi:hypothetical protein
MIKTSQQKGFKIEFANGWIASIQFGPGNYCDNYHESIGEEQAWESGTAEVAAINPNTNELHQFDGWNDSVKGWQSPQEVLEFLNMVASQGKE